MATSQTTKKENKTMTEAQKTLLFYALAAIQETLYFDTEYNRIDYNYENFRLDVIELSKITNDLNKLNKLIDATLDALCK
jgi:uncharacterized protein YijF (DUF1287 family)